MPWSRKKVVSALEPGLIVSLSVSGSPLFFISRSAVNSPSTSHLIVTIPNRQFASVGNRSGESARVVIIGNPETIPKRRSGKFRPDLDNGSVVGIDGSATPSNESSPKREALQFCPLRQEKSAALLLHYTLQMRASECN